MSGLYSYSAPAGGLKSQDVATKQTGLLRAIYALRFPDDWA